MKKLLIIALVATASLSVMAQGKVSIANDSNRLITYTTDTRLLLVADAAKAGTAVASGATTADAGFKAQLFYNSDSTVTDMGLLTTALTPVVYNSTGLGAGRLPTTTVNTPDSGKRTFVLKVWSSSFANYDSAAQGGGYVGTSPVIHVTAGTLSPNPINSAAYSDWAAGPIYVGLVPEPSTAAIAGLGVASLLIFRRRK